MSNLIALYLSLASGLPATTYGWGEMMCGPVGNPRRCEGGAVTASGLPFHPDEVHVALAAPARLRVPAGGIRVWMRLQGGKCLPVMVTDKMNPRWIGLRGFDLSPGAIRQLGEIPSPNWSGYIHLCSGIRRALTRRDPRWETRLNLSRDPTRETNLDRSPGSEEA